MFAPGRIPFGRCARQQVRRLCEPRRVCRRQVCLSSTRPSGLPQAERSRRLPPRQAGGCRSARGLAPPRKRDPRRRCRCGIPAARTVRYRAPDCAVSRPGNIQLSRTSTVRTARYPASCTPIALLPPISVPATAVPVQRQPGSLPLHARRCRSSCPGGSPLLPHAGVAPRPPELPRLRPGRSIRPDIGDDALHNRAQYLIVR